MKKMLFSILFSLAMVAAAQAETGPKISFNNEVYDFGEVEKGQKVQYNFEFKNSGDAELVISEVKPSCGCTTAEMAKKNFAPGESGTIPITFDSTRFSGNIQKTVTVVSNDSTNPRKQIKLKGRIIQEVAMTPNYLTLVNIKRSENIERSIDISSERLDRLEVTELTSTVPFLKLETVRKDDKNVSVKVTFAGTDIPADQPTHTGFISFKTNAKSQAEAKINVYIKVANPIQTTPRAVYMFASPKGKAREQSVTLKNNSGGAYKITDISTDLSFIKVTQDGDDKLKVVLSEGAETGKFAGVITVKTNLAEQPEIKIPVRGNVI